MHFLGNGKRVAACVALTLCPVLASGQQVPARDAAKLLPLEGDWQIAGDREIQQFPVIALTIRLVDNQLIATGHAETRCASFPRDGGGGSVSLIGEITDGTFTLRPRTARSSIQLTVTGKLPAEGATHWEGRYALKGAFGGSHGCQLDQGAPFTSAPLIPLNGTFVGQLMLRTTGRKFDFSISVEQGEFRTHPRNVGLADKFLPLFGTIDVAGVPCFERGKWDGTPYSRVEGDMVKLRFTMDDDSEVSMVGVFTNAEESGLLVRTLSVKGGKCDLDWYVGALNRRK